jgi:hypothetical protein
MLTWFKNLHPLQKVAVVGGALWGASLLVGGSGGLVVSKAVRGLVQNSDAWGRMRLGTGGSTIGGGGCLLTALTMAVNALKGLSMTPPQVNDVGVAAGAFGSNSSEMNPAVLAQALGLHIVERIRNEPTHVPDMIRVVDEALAAGGLAVVHVDYTEDARGDHFVLVNGKTGSGYTAVDPVSGKTISLNDGLRGPSKWGSTTKNYVPVGAFSLAVA